MTSTLNGYSPLISQKTQEFEQQSKEIQAQIEELRSSFIHLIAEAKGSAGLNFVLSKVEETPHEDPVRKFGPDVNLGLPILSLAFSLYGPLAAFLTVGSWYHTSNIRGKLTYA